MSPAFGPKVSIGLPVYNGARYLAASIDSILNQTFRDFELIISDNASTDATGDICLGYASRDDRINYLRQGRNIGAGPNHNFCARRASGEYFRWASHDDLMEPEYLAKCVFVLEANPDAVLCHSKTRIIGDKGETFAVHLAGLDAPRASDRFAAVILKPHWCVEMFGVIRTNALLRTNLMSGYFGGDKTMLAELALLGRFLHVPEPLFINRDHPERSLRAVPFHRRQEFHDTRNVRRRVTHWALYTDYWRAVRTHVSDRSEKARCYGHLMRWWFSNLHIVRLPLDVVFAFLPGAAAPMYRLREMYHRRGIGSAKAK
jgi:glycosyltransferase involved in cell wall biosynthesis